MLLCESTVPGRDRTCFNGLRRWARCDTASVPQQGTKSFVSHAAPFEAVPHRYGP
jgi:hypothetical protein